MTENPALNAASLQGRAETLAQNLPPLLARAIRLADGVILGEHGRRRAGIGGDFWQYRPAIAGDSARAIDWRRSARSDQHFVQQKEWQAAQIVTLWADNAAAMQYSSDVDLPSKANRAALVALAISALLIRGGEQVGLTHVPARRGQVQLQRLAAALAHQLPLGIDEYGHPEIQMIPHHSRAVFLSDFLGDLDQLGIAMAQLADKGVKGALVQILDPTEEAFPFQGRTLFESMGRGLRHETHKARELRGRYIERLAARKYALAEMAARSGWQYHCHHTDGPASEALLWLFHVLEARR